MIYQSFELLSQISVLDNVLLPMDFCGIIPLAERLPRAMELLSQMEISDHAHKLPGMVSGGQKQRVAIARAMANDPDLLLADEPTGNLDSTTSAVIYSLFRKLVEQGRTVIMVTHDRSASRHADHVLELRDGRIVGTNRPDGVA